MTKLYLPKQKKVVEITESDLMPQKAGKETERDYLTRKKEAEEVLSQHDRTLFGKTMMKPGLKCSKCAWLQFSVKVFEEDTEVPPYCWLYGAVRKLAGKEKKDREDSFYLLTCIGETDVDYLAQRIGRVPAMGRGSTIRKTWFKKNFPKTYNKLTPKQKEYLTGGAKRASKEELKKMTEKTKKLISQQETEEVRHMKQKFKTLAQKISMDERIMLRIRTLQAIAKVRNTVIRNIQKQIKSYSTQYARWSTEKFYDALVYEISLDLQDLYNYYLAAKTIRWLTPGIYLPRSRKFRSVISIFNLLKDKADKYGVTKHEAVSLEAKKLPQVKFFAPLVGLGVFDFKDFTPKSTVRLRKYMRSHKIKSVSKLPDELATKVYRGWTSVEKYKEMRKNAPSINKQLLKGLKTSTPKLLQFVILKEGQLIWKEKLPLLKRISILNGLYANFLDPMHLAVRNEMIKEKNLFDKKYLSTISRLESTLPLPVSISQMFLLNADTKKSIVNMTTEQLQVHRRKIEEDVRYSPSYKNYVDTIMLEIASVDTKFMKYKIDAVMDKDPTTGLLYKQLKIKDKVRALDDAEKSYVTMLKQFKKRKLSKKSKIRFDQIHRKIKPIQEMSFNEMFTALEIIKERESPTEKPEVEKPIKKYEEPKPAEVGPGRTKMAFLRDSVSKKKFDVEVTVDYDVSGKVLAVWDVSYKLLLAKPGPWMPKERHQWKASPLISKRDKKRARKTLKGILGGLSDIKGLEYFTIVASPSEKSQYLRMGFKPVTKEIRKQINKVSTFDKPFLRKVNLYMG